MPGRLAARQDPRGPQALWRHLWRAPGARPAPPRRGPGLAQAGGAADGRPRPAGGVPAQALALLHPPGPAGDAGGRPVGRDFTAPAPDRLWVADISRIPTGEGPLWLACVRDAFSRRIVGWKTSDRADTDLVLGALR